MEESCSNVTVFDPYTRGHVFGSREVFQLIKSEKIKHIAECIERCNLSTSEDVEEEYQSVMKIDGVAYLWYFTTERA